MQVALLTKNPVELHYLNFFGALSLGRKERNFSWLQDNHKAWRGTGHPTEYWEYGYPKYFLSGYNLCFASLQSKISNCLKPIRICLFVASVRRKQIGWL